MTEESRGSERHAGPRQYCRSVCPRSAFVRRGASPDQCSTWTRTGVPAICQNTLQL